MRDHNVEGFNIFTFRHSGLRPWIDLRSIGETGELRNRRNVQTDRGQVVSCSGQSLLDM